MRTAKIVGAVVVGVVVWGLLWTFGTQAMAPDLVSGAPIEGTGLLLGFVIYSGVLSVATGWLTTLIVGANPMPAVWALGGVNFLIGVFVQSSAWSLFPIWYHVLFLGLVIPATLLGGRMGARGRVGA